MYFFIISITFYLHVIQTEVLILCPSTVVQFDLHIRIGIWRIQVLHVGVCQWIIKDESERMLGIFHLGQLSIIEGGINNRRKISYRFEFLQEIFDLVALLYIGADWVGATD